MSEVKRIKLPEYYLEQLRKYMCIVRNEYTMYSESGDKKDLLAAAKMDFMLEETWSNTTFTAKQLRRYAKAIGNTPRIAFLPHGDNFEDESCEPFVICLIDGLREFARYANEDDGVVSD